MLGKVRPTTRRANGSAPLPAAGLSKARLDLVHRYMIDAEEAETRERSAAAEQEEARVRADAQARAAAEEQTRREAAERTRIRMVHARRRDEPAAPTALQLADHEPAPRERPLVSEGVRGTEAPARAEKRAAKQAARQIAALEKREARERKALAKAAARRRGGHISGN